MVNGARILGPAVAGITVAASAKAGASCQCGELHRRDCGAFVMTVTPRPRVAGSPVCKPCGGFHWVARTGRSSPAASAGLVSLTGMPYVVLMPIFAAKVLHSGARGLGLLMGAAGVGALMDYGARGAPRRARTRKMGDVRRHGIRRLLILFSMSHWFWLSVLLILPAGFALICKWLLQHSHSNHGPR